MLNYYSLWKYLMLIVVLFIGLLYSLPNLYGEDPAIQITGVKGIAANEHILNKISNILKKNKIESKSITLKNGVILIRFNNFDFQLYAREVLIASLKKQYIVALNLAPATPYWLRVLGAEPIKLGLDLRGGIHFLMNVDMKTVLSKLQEQNIDRLRSDLREKRISYLSIKKIDNYGIKITFHDNSKLSQIKSYLISRYQDLLFTTTNSKKILTVIITDKHIREVRNYAVLQNINIIRNRINQLGVTEALVQQEGSDRIVVELPGIQDTAQAKEILGATATLEFRLVNTDIDNSAIYRGHIPSNSEIKYTRDGEPVVLYKRVILTGNHIIDSISGSDEIGNSEVNINLDSTGGFIMSNFTRNNQDKLMATLFIEYKDSGQKDINHHTIFTKDEKIINIARISSHFSSKFRIIGINNKIEARQLSLLLRAGALIAPIQIIEERIIGPTLGLLNIKQGIKASLAALLASILFMVIYYRKFGLIASSALLVNLILIIAAMSLLPSITLTMPGIAGIVLTLAVAVDANVLINERIKEELKNGRSVQQAINEGYKGAFSSILDANLTTVIIVIILYMIGIGPIKSFAITTAIGIITSMFTSIIGTRAIVNLLYGNKHIKKLSI
ncbi:MAG: protein translocase subunit SecD [Arsenophonus sp. ET-YP4-MAG3]